MDEMVRQWLADQGAMRPIGDGLRTHADLPVLVREACRVGVAEPAIPGWPDFPRGLSWVGEVMAIAARRGVAPGESVRLGCMWLPRHVLCHLPEEDRSPYRPILDLARQAVARGAPAGAWIGVGGDLLGALPTDRGGFEASVIRDAAEELLDAAMGWVEPRLAAARIAMAGAVLAAGATPEMRESDARDAGMAVLLRCAGDLHGARTAARTPPIVPDR